MTWEQMTQEQRINILSDALLLTAVGAVEPIQANKYVNSRDQNTDVAERMRLDLEYWTLVDDLREAGRIPSAEDIHQKAKSMVTLSSKDMFKALQEYHKEVLQTQ